MAAARQQFAALGYDRTSIRAIAHAAAVDPGLVTHFFGSKQALFVTVVGLPFEPAEVLPRLLAGGVEGLGRRLAEFVLGIYVVEAARERFLGLLRAAASEAEAARLVRELVTREMFAPLAEAIGADQPLLRANLVGAHVVGLTFARYIVGVEPLASAEPGAVVAATAPVFQHYLTGPID